MSAKLNGALIFSTILLLFLLAPFSQAYPVSYLVQESPPFTLYEDPQGNWTYTRKAVSPMRINAGQIKVGANWTYVYSLVEDRTYHIYCYGDWVSEEASHKTDYDIYVYNPLGELEGYHTEAAGIPEHLGDTVDQPFFTPDYTGNYSFVIRNDPRESQAAEPATFMAIDNIETNIWHTRFIEGKEGVVPKENTSWAYEFTSTSSQIEIEIQVPDTLDMYEARLYLMANPENEKGEFLNGVPLAWEPALYGETSGSFGGYNLESTGFKGNAYASCEYPGQDMFINYTAPYDGVSLYHLVLIGEAEEGNINFRVKTGFNDSKLELLPVEKVYPYNETIICAVSDIKLQAAFLNYSINYWNTSVVSEMQIFDGFWRGIIPGQEIGTFVQYSVQTIDVFGEEVDAYGNFTVKRGASIDLELNREMIRIGEVLTLSGLLTPSQESPIRVHFTSQNQTIRRNTDSSSDGSWIVDFSTDMAGDWSVQARFNGDNITHGTLSGLETFRVDTVNTFTNTPPFGNWTYIRDPIFPVHIEESQIPVGTNWTVLCNLVAGHQYHIYFYGDWVETRPEGQTDYDVYVYNPLGGLESYHTQSAHMQENLGLTVTSPNRHFFTPDYTGNYSFVIRNDPRESQAAQAATFMIIEHLECNVWHEVNIDGKHNGLYVESTSRTVELTTDASDLEVLIKVPDSLDMYEARLYLMANPKNKLGGELKGEPLAWEPGLYGEVDSSGYGGYNIRSGGYGGIAVASCEFYGQDMQLNYTAPFEGGTMYHLVLLGEEGVGRVRFLIKTNFNRSSLELESAPLLVYPEVETNLTFKSSTVDVVESAIYYTVDCWENVAVSNMRVTGNRVCSVTLPGQPAGTVVEYNVIAKDVLENLLTYNGSFPVKFASQLNVTLETPVISIGENVTVNGFTTPNMANMSVTLVFISANSTSQQTVYSYINGSFSSSFMPLTAGSWGLQAFIECSEIVHGSRIVYLNFKVKPLSFFRQYSMYIYAGIGVTMVGAAVIYLKKFRE